MSHFCIKSFLVLVGLLINPLCAWSQSQLGDSILRAIAGSIRPPAAGGSVDCKATPIDEQFVVQQIGANAYLAVGVQHVLYVDAQGSVWGWGDNSKGVLAQGRVVGRDPLGNVTTQWSPNILIQPQKIDIEDAKAAYATATNSYVLKRDGTVWAWGIQRFNGTGHQADEPWPIPTQVAGLPRIAFLRTWDRGVHAFAYDGSVWVWGYGNPAATLQGHTDKIVRAGGYPFAAQFSRPELAKVPCVVDTHTGADDANSTSILTSDKRIVHAAWGVSRPGPNVTRLLSNSDRAVTAFDLVYGVDQSGGVVAWASQDISSGVQSPVPALLSLSGLGSPISHARDEFDVFLQKTGKLVVWGQRTQAAHPYFPGIARADNVPVEVSLPMQIEAVVSHPTGIFLVASDRSIYKRDRIAEPLLTLRRGVGSQRLVLIHAGTTRP